MFMLDTGWPPLISRLHNRLKQGPLPGQDAHFKMAHAVRKAGVIPDDKTKRDAAVLIILFEKTPGDWHVVFIKRTAAHEQDKHAGQIGFPGGKREPNDPDLLFTALREANEEINIDLAAIDVLGELTPLYITVSKFMVHPYVSYTWKEPKLKHQEDEIEEIFEFPLKDFLDTASRSETRIRIQSGIVLNHVPSVEIQGYTIWGATAMIMHELIDLLVDT